MSPLLVNPPLPVTEPHNEKPVEKLRGWVQDKRKRKLSDPHKIRYQAHGVDASKADIHVPVDIMIGSLFSTRKHRFRNRF